MAKPLPNYVAGEWRVATTTVPNVNPSNTDDVINEHCFATADDTRAAVEAARAAFPGWARTTPQQRHDVLRRASDEIFARQEELGRLLAREEGKPCPKPRARSAARARSSISSPARRFVWPARSFRQSDPVSRWRSPASRWA